MNYTFFIVFMIIAIVVYSFLNYYFLKKHNNIITTKSLFGLILKMVIFALIITPVATMIFSYANMPLQAAFTGFTGYSWLAFIFLFIFIHGSADIILFIIEKTGVKLSKSLYKILFFVTVTVSLSVIFWGYFEAQDIQLKKLICLSPKIKKNTTIKIMHITDVHFSPLTTIKTAKKIQQIFIQEKPDILISTGDLLDKGILHKKAIEQILTEIKPPLGKYAITGNHEFIAGIDNSIEFTKKCGFSIIRDSIVNINKTISLVGIEDISSEKFSGNNNQISDKQLLCQNTNYNKNYTIYLKHQPRIYSESYNYFDLMLSGHTHGGQIFPFTLLVRMSFKYITGLYHLNNNTDLYVSNGAGTWGPPIRFLAPPEITIFTLKYGKSNSCEYAK